MIKEGARLNQGCIEKISLGISEKITISLMFLRSSCFILSEISFRRPAGSKVPQLGSRASPKRFSILDPPIRQV